jgi:serine/threonine protein kinase
MIVLDPARRISMKEALRHPYFNELSESEKNSFLRN